MTVSAADLALYAGALLILLLTPGPVWIAVIARAMSGGAAAVWPLALGVAVGDAVWPLLAIFGLAWITAQYAGFLALLQWVAVMVFLAMGVALIRHADRTIHGDSRLARPGHWAGFAAGLAAILGNPKAILFYMGVLPGFFDLSRITSPDVALIVIVSVLVPLAGNLGLAASIGRARHLLSSPAALRRLNLTAGGLLVAVGVVIALT